MRYIAAIGILANKRRTELPEDFSPETSNRNARSSYKSTMTFTSIAKTTYMNPKTST